MPPAVRRRPRNRKPVPDDRCRAGMDAAAHPGCPIADPTVVRRKRNAATVPAASAHATGKSFAARIPISIARWTGAVAGSAWRTATPAARPKQYAAMHAVATPNAAARPIRMRQCADRPEPAASTATAWMARATKETASPFLHRWTRHSRSHSPASAAVSARPLSA